MKRSSTSVRRCAHAALPLLVALVAVDPASAQLSLPQLNSDPTGTIQTNDASFIIPPFNPFFTAFGSNGRNCKTCHNAQFGMSISAASTQQTYSSQGPSDPLFAAVDGANCPDQVSSAPKSKSTYSLMLNKALVRIFLPVPKNAEFTIEVLSDPTKCEINSTYGLTNATNPTISVYRRPLVAGNLPFIRHASPPLGNIDPLTGLPTPPDPYNPGQFQSGNIMSDGREPTLESQALDAIIVHEESAAPSDAMIESIVDFENGLYGAQIYDNAAGFLNVTGAYGGPGYIQLQAPGWNGDALEFSAWSSLPWWIPIPQQAMSIARGENIFNTRTFTISNVAGFNDRPLVGNNVIGTCSTCHSQLAVMSDPTVNSQEDLGVVGDSTASLPSPDLPLFKLTCLAGATTPYNGSTVITWDPGRALITGKCADIGKSKVTQLRSLTARAPYFHDGSAATLNDVLTFYVNRFDITLSAQDRTDLINFMKAL